MEQFDEILAVLAAFFAAFPEWVTAAMTIMIAAKTFVALTPTPRDDEILGKIYKIVELLALNIGRAKQMPPNSVERPSSAVDNARLQSHFVVGLLAVAAVASLMGGCASYTARTAAAPPTPAQAFYAARLDQRGLNASALSYARLPDCGGAEIGMCSRSDVVTALADGAEMLDAAVDDWEVALRCAGEIKDGNGYPVPPPDSVSCSSLPPDFDYLAATQLALAAFRVALEKRLEVGV